MSDQIEKIDDEISRMSDHQLIQEARADLAFMALKIKQGWGDQLEYDKLSKNLQDFKTSVENEKIALREAAIAKANMEASADKYLTALDQIERQSLGPDAMSQKKGN